MFQGRSYSVSSSSLSCFRLVLIVFQARPYSVSGSSLSCFRLVLIVFQARPYSVSLFSERPIGKFSGVAHASFFKGTAGLNTK